MASHSWGGRALPQLQVVYSGTPYVWTFVSRDGIKPAYFWLPVGKALRETESGLLRRRSRGYRLRVEIEFDNLENDLFVDFMRKLIQTGEAVFYPHPAQTYNPNYSDDYWNVVVESDFDFRFFDDRFIGHKGKIILNGKTIDEELPVDISGGLGGT